VDWDTTKNLFIEGDNLEVLKLLQKSYHKKVKMIYIDPPYNTGNEFIYPDRFQDNLDTYLRYTGQVDDEGFKVSTNSETGGRYHTNWLNMMYPRLKLARNLLRDDGVIFISIDDNEVANLRKICDEIFGEENFVAHIIWQHSVQPKGYNQIYSVHHNHILSYRKSESYQINSLERTEEDNKNYSNPDNDPKGRWRSGDVRNALFRPNLIFDIKTPSGKIIKPPENGWRWSKETIEKKIDTGEIVFSKDETRIIRKIYLANQEGRAPETIWFGKDVGVTREGAGELKDLFEDKTPFDTVKPTRLINRMLQIAGCDSNDIVLDFFAGSCSTAHAVFNYGRGHYIVVQLPQIVDESVPHGKIALQYGLITVAEIGKERIRRAGKKIREENPDYDGDLGFKVFKLDSSNIKPWDADFDNYKEALMNSVENIKTERTEQDVLYELLLKYGLDLTIPIETRSIHGKNVYIIGAGALVVCLDDEITLNAVEGIAKLKEELKPEIMRVVFKDAGFKDATVKTNTVQILKIAGIEDVKSL
jgi:adenine-specific DNA-methyltransferase